MEYKDRECRMCGKNTMLVVNINFKATSICDECCDRIILQHVHYMIREINLLRHRNKGRK